jgi:hypothetical protein
MIQTAPDNMVRLDKVWHDIASCNELLHHK